MFSKYIWPIFFGICLAAVLVLVPYGRMRLALQQSRFDHLILKASAENGCDPNLVKAIVWRESKFDSTIRGNAGEFGLMQVMPTVGNEWAAARGDKKMDPNLLFDPETNLRVGSWYIAKALQQWDKASVPVPLALAQYNAGRSNVLKWIDANCLSDHEHFISRIQFPSTRAYVRDILKQYSKYREHGEF